MRFFLSYLAVADDVVTLPSSNYLSEVGNMLITLFFLLLIAFGILYFLKKVMRTRMRFMNRSSVIKVLEKKPLHPKASLYLIEVLGKGVVIAETQGNISLLTELPPETDLDALFQEEPTSMKETLQGKFSKLFKK